MRFVALAFVLFAFLSAAPRERYLAVWAMEANGFPGKGEGRDFLAVFDVGANFGQLVSVVPTSTRGMMAHHSNPQMPANRLLFAADFMASEGHVFNLSDAQHPQLAGSFAAAQGYTHMHSFAALSNGHALATYQLKGWDRDEPGALVELDRDGRVIRASDAAVPAVDPNIRPYGLLVLEKLDRVVTTSAPMLSVKAPTHVIQIWRLSDLKLLQTIDLKPAVHGVAAESADDAALLDDGTTVIVKTARCGLFALTDVNAEHARVEEVYDFGARTCSGVPVVAGHYWVEALQSAHAVVVLDVKDPNHPREVSHLYLGPGASPHWLSLEPQTGNIVITGYGSLINRISFATLDAENGSLTLDPRFIDLAHRTWPDGWSGGVIPHGAVFFGPSVAARPSS